MIRLLARRAIRATRLPNIATNMAAPSMAITASAIRCSEDGPPNRSSRAKAGLSGRSGAGWGDHPHHAATAARFPGRARRLRPVCADCGDPGLQLIACDTRPTKKAAFTDRKRVE